MIIIGIDPGSRVTGYGILRSDGTKDVVIDYGCIRPSPKMLLTDRYLAIYEGVSELIDRYQANELAVETQYVKENVQSALKLGMARGAVMIAARQKNLPVFEYAPTKAKLAVTGTGRASKFQVQGMVKLLLNLVSIPQPEDAADALAIALCHAHAARNEWSKNHQT